MLPAYVTPKLPFLSPLPIPMELQTSSFKGIDPTSKGESLLN